MSQVMSKLNQIAAKYKTRYKPNESTSSLTAQSWVVRDSHPSRSMMTNMGLLVLSLGLCCIPTLLLSNSNVLADDSITITLDKSTVNLDMANKNAAGTFAKSSGNTVSVTTTNGAGYTLGIKADGEDPTKLINSSDSNTDTNHLTSISSATTEEQFKALAGTAYNGMWGYLPSKLNSNANTDFLPAPTTTGDIIDETSAANSSANEYTIALGARVDSTQKLGSYTNTYVIYASANGFSYDITYNNNVVFGMPANVISGKAIEGQVSFSDSEPVREGYTFEGWCTVSDSSIKSQADCVEAGGTFYAKNSSTTIDVNDTKFNLYAVWSGGSSGGSGSNCTISGENSITGNMQDAKSADTYCDGATGSMTDTRDSQTYTVAKINGNLWMTRNLAIGCNGSGSSYSATVKSRSLTSANSNVSTAWSTPTELLSTKANSYTTSGYTTAAIMCSADYGAWYNYVAATAGTITTNSNITSAEYDICPAGWSLPKYSQIASMISDDGPDKYPSAFSPVAGGYYFNGSLSYTGNGFWWSATAIDTMSRYYLYYSSSNKGLYTSSSGRYVGNYVRCVRSS